MDKIIENKTCRECKNTFDITQDDINFYNKVSPIFGGERFQIPTPTLCPYCRRQRRLSWLNELQLYKNTCAGCGTSIISRFNPENSITNYCNKCWSCDSWDALDYGKDIDFAQSIFQQIGGIMSEIPFQNLIGSLSNIENNSVYTNHTADIKDCYMVSESDNIEKSYYSRNLRHSSYLFDCSYCVDSNHGYECNYCANIYNCFFVSYSQDCGDSYFLQDCQGCSFCIGCVGLNNKKYHILNKQVSKQEYEDVKKILFSSQGYTTIIIPYKDMIESYELGDLIKFSENCSGKGIYNSSNCYNCENTIFSEDCRYSSDVNHSTDLMDISSYGSNSYLMYEGLGVGRYSHNVLFSAIIGRGENLLYCIDTKKSQHCFGCVSLKFGKYCIFNKQYSKQEYEKLLPQIIEHMKKIGEWGEFFPASMSPFGYNETVAQEVYPLSQEQVEKHLWNWSDYTSPLPKVDKIIPANRLPGSISDIPDDILSWAIECEITKKPFRIITQELEFYRKHNLPIPRKHPDQRRLERANINN